MVGSVSFAEHNAARQGHSVSAVVKPEVADQVLGNIADNLFEEGKADLPAFYTAGGNLENPEIWEWLRGEGGRSAAKREIDPVHVDLLKWYFLSTEQLLAIIDKGPADISKQASAFLAGRWFGHRARGPYNSASAYDQPSEKSIEEMVKVIRAVAAKGATRDQIFSAAGKALIGNGFSKEDWSALTLRTSAHTRAPTDDSAIRQMQSVFRCPPWKLASAAMDGFLGEFLGEPNDGQFLMTASAIATVPQLVKALTSKPGVTVHAFGSVPKEEQPSLNTVQDKVSWADKNSPLTRWVTDYRGIPVKPRGGKQGSPVLLDALYGGRSDKREDEFPAQQAEAGGWDLRRLPVFMEGGNLLKIREGLNVASTRVLEANKQKLGYPEAELKDLFEKTFGKTLFLPYTDSATGHVDMDLTPISTKKGNVVLVPQVDVPTDATIRSLLTARHSMLDASDSLSLVPRSRAPIQRMSDAGKDLAEIPEKVQLAMKETQRRASVYDTIAKELSPHVKVVRIPTLVSRNWFPNWSEAREKGALESGTSSNANSLFFYDSTGKSHLIVPDYPEAPMYASVKKKFVEQVSPYVDNIEFVSTYSETLKRPLAADDGVFHCVAPQCRLLPRRRK